MCLIVLAYHVHPGYPLVVAANRDEFYRRPTSPAHFWEDHPNVLAGRDLEKMGTWMGIAKTGRFSAITNYRDPSSELADARSRGELVSRFLYGDETPEQYLAEIGAMAEKYNGFNLIIGDVSSLYYFSNRNRVMNKLKPGIYGLSNASLDTPWPKVAKSKQRLASCLSEAEKVSPDCLFDLLADADQADDAELPDTGVTLEMERLLSPTFIQSPDYGTRASTVLLIDREGYVTFRERSFHPAHEAAYHFSITG